MDNEVKYQKCSGICVLVLELNRRNFEWRTDTQKWRGQCRKCQGKGHIIIESEIKYQICAGDCKRKLKLNEDNYSLRDKEKQIYYRRCKICMTEINKKKRKEYGEKNREKITKKQKQYYKIANIIKTANIPIEDGVLFRICSCCHIAKELNHDNFHWAWKNEQIYKLECKLCKLNLTTEQKEEAKQRTKKWREATNNKQMRNEKERKRRQNDPEYKFMYIISRFITYEITKTQKDSINKKRTRDNLNFTYEEWVLVRNFYFSLPENKWMTEFNQGKYNIKTWNDNDHSTLTWQLDHIIPRANFTFNSFDHPYFNICWNLFNLRPYSAKDNIIEGTNRTRHNKFDLSASSIFEKDNFNNFLKTQNIPDEKRYELLDRMYEFIDLVKNK